MPRLLILCEYPTLLGGERSMLATLPAVRAAGCDVHVAAPEFGPLADRLRDQEIPHVAMRLHDDADVRQPLNELRRELDRTFDHIRPQLVHANSLSMARIAGPAVAVAGIPSIGHLRDIVGLSRQAVDDLNCHRRLIAVSQAACEFHVAQGIDGEKCVVVNNGVDLATFCPRAGSGKLHRELELPPDAKLVATIGQIGLRKGTEIALTAARRVIEELPNVHWLVIGERTSDKFESREFESQLRALANEPPLSGRVHFLGTRGDMTELFAECELVVHAARQEPLGRILLESAASGVAVVATDVGGTREIFPSEASGAMLVPPDDARALAEAALVLLRDDQRRAEVGAAGRRAAEAAFDIRLAADRLIEQYHALL